MAGRFTMNEVFLFMQAQLKQNMRKACLVVENDAKRNCPVDNGHLRASIASEVQITSNTIMGVIGSNVDYAPYVHQGTGIYAIDGDGRPTPWRYKDPITGDWVVTIGQKPNPFLKKAAERNKDIVSVILSEGLI